MDEQGSEEKKKTGTRASQVNTQSGQEGADFLNSYAGVGTDAIGANALATSFLSITQDTSESVVNKVVEPGVFFNTGTQKNLGTEVKVVVVAFKIVWDERDTAGKTVARYEPQGISVTMVPPPAGKQGYPTMVNPLTSNKVIETYAYALVLPDDPGAGFVMMTAGVGSMKAFRRWNTVLKQTTLPNGEVAPVFAKQWLLSCGSQISKTTNKPFFALENVTDLGWVNKELFEKAVLPAREQSTALLLAAPTVADDSSLAVEGN